MRFEHYVEGRKKFAFFPYVGEYSILINVLSHGGSCSTKSSQLGVAQEIVQDRIIINLECRNSSKETSSWIPQRDICNATFSLPILAYLVLSRSYGVHERVLHEAGDQFER